MFEFTTMEKLQYDGGSLATVLRYNDHVIYTERNWKGEYLVDIYEFIDEPNEEFDECECRLNHIESNGQFNDGGHAVEWAINKINTL